MRSDRRVRLMSDYGADWPLWGDEGESQPAALGLSDDLTARLQAWQRLFEERFHYESGWRSTEDTAAYAADGVQGQRLLTAEAGQWASISLDLWPVTAGSDRPLPE